MFCHLLFLFSVMYLLDLSISRLQSLKPNSELNFNLVLFKIFHLIKKSMLLCFKFKKYFGSFVVCLLLMLFKKICVFYIFVKSYQTNAKISYSCTSIIKSKIIAHNNQIQNKIIQTMKITHMTNFATTTKNLA